MTESINQSDPRYQDAKKRVNELREFYQHLWTYIGINVVLFLINLITAPGVWWFYWVTVFWGIAVIMHAVSTFGTNRIMSKDWEDRKIKELLDKDKK